MQTLVIFGGNPAYNAPAELNWSELQKSVTDVVRLGLHVDETGTLAGTQLAAAHYLESWGDARTADGTVVPVQPMILPLFGGLTEIEVIARIAGQPNPDPYAMVYATVTGLAGGAAEKVFQRFLYDGFLENSAYAKVSVDFDNAALQKTSAAAPLPSLSKDHLEVRFVTDYKMDDGRFANNGWLQEVPDPITKISWDNAILVSPRFAKELGIGSKGAVLQVARDETQSFVKGKESAPIAEVTLGDRRIRGPVHIQVGLSNYTIILPLGYGRTVSGRIGQGAGFSAYPLRESGAPHVATGATLRLTGETMVLADTQEHWSMEGRDLVREANFDEDRENPGYVKEEGMESETPSVLDGPVGPQGGKMTPAERATQIPRGNSLYVTPKFDWCPPVGNEHRPQCLHRLQRLRRRVSG